MLAEAGVTQFFLHNRLMHIVGIGAIIALLAAFFWLRLDIDQRVSNPDEWIPVSVSEGMSKRGDLDPDWFLAEMKEAPYFRYHQYNFYSYNLASHLVLKATQWTGLTPIQRLRLTNLLYQVIAIGAAMLAARWMGFAPFSILFIGAALIFSPALVHDAQMARPESFLYMLLGLALLCLARPTSVALFLAGLLIGVGASTKISFVLDGLVFLPLLFAPLRTAVTRASLLTLGTLAGFAASAPYALIHFDAFMYGVAILKEQYAGVHLPHSHTPLRTLGVIDWVAGFLLIVYGALFPLALLIFPAMYRRASTILWGVWLFIAVTSLYFGFQQVFFERNFGPAVIAAVVITGAILSTSRSHTAQAVVLATVLVPMIYWSAQIALSARENDLRRGAFIAQHGLTVNAWLWSQQGSIAVPACHNVVAVQSYRDDRTAQIIEAIEHSGYERVAQYRSRFEALPASTLQTYMDTGALFFKCKPQPAVLLVPEFQ
jgi:hypothetical protein